MEQREKESKQRVAFTPLWFGSWLNILTCAPHTQNASFHPVGQCRHSTRSAMGSLTPVLDTVASSAKRKLPSSSSSSWEGGRERQGQRE